jgi:hypothetical protein
MEAVLPAHRSAHSALIFEDNKMSDLEELKNMTRETYNEFVRRGIAEGRRPNDEGEPSDFRNAMRQRTPEFSRANAAILRRMGDLRGPLYNRLSAMSYTIDEVEDVNRFMETNNYPVELKRAVFHFILQSLRDLGIARIDPTKAGDVSAGKIKALSKQGLALPEDIERSVVGMLTGREETSAEVVARRSRMLGRPAAADVGCMGGRCSVMGGRRRKSTGVSGRRKKTRKARSRRWRNTGSRTPQR